ncbi:ASCH domain-containing protein [Erwinia rhapontici]|uniref:ASCH domain-containing protein n=1 Tax=Erwinia rhapontici TaxID=55212 RepID=UPI001438270A|nr:ASCH domain-containing protein [Erwinia rhapontici]NKG31907.1 ASCH domain-containing protein [Erwinia rhapontici]
MSMIEKLKVKYPGAIAWAFGDSPEMADELAELVIKGVKTATCGSLSSFKNEEGAPTIGGYSIILNGRDEPVCVIRTISLCIVRFCDVDEDLARKEGEGDLSLKYWRTEHKAFFSREGTYQEDMELVAEEFERVEVL